jgi:hypothetical protein
MNNNNTYDNLINMYTIINGTTGNVTRSSIIKFQSNTPGYVAISLIQRTDAKIAAGTYDADVYAYIDNENNTDVICDHIDISLLGNLS